LRYAFRVTRFALRLFALRLFALHLLRCAFLRYPKHLVLLYAFLRDATPFALFYAFLRYPKHLVPLYAFLRDATLFAPFYAFLRDSTRFCVACCCATPSALLQYFSRNAFCVAAVLFAQRLLRYATCFCATPFSLR
jgi:hypothetical protein